MMIQSNLYKSYFCKLLLNHSVVYSSVLLNTRKSVCTSGIQFKKIPNNLRGKSKPSQEWLTRQLNDPYVARAFKESYRARSAFKLLEIDDKYRFLHPGLGVIECGCAPGAWTQVLVNRINAAGIISDKPMGKAVGVDLKTVGAIPGVTFLGGCDFTRKDVQERMIAALESHPCDVVLSDMAPNATGTHSLDHEVIMKLAYAVAIFARDNGTPGGHLLIKLWQGEKTKKFKEELSQLYEKVMLVKPPCSRDDSTEIFVYASGLKCGVKKK